MEDCVIIWRLMIFEDEIGHPIVSVVVEDQYSLWDWGVQDKHSPHGTYPKRTQVGYVLRETMMMVSINHWSRQH